MLDMVLRFAVRGAEYAAVAIVVATTGAILWLVLMALGVPRRRRDEEDD